MPLIACFLRAVNVGGRRATNAELVAAARAAGLEHVSAYQAAGNLVVEAGDHDETDLTTLLEATLEERLGFVTEVVARTGPQIAAAVASVPWSEAQVDEATGRPQVVLCRATPDAGTRVEALALATDTDLLELVGRDLHWLPIGGSARAEIDSRRLGALLHPATSRTVGTLDRIHGRFFGG